MKTKNKKEKTENNKVNYYLFWCNHRQSVNKSVRGFLMSRFTKEDIEQELTDWCEKFSFWREGESFISYGYKRIAMPSRKSLLKKWTPLCNKRKKINDEWDMVRMLLNFAK